MGKNQLIHGNEFHLLKQAEIHKATGKLVESLNLAAGSTGGFDIYKVVEAYFTDLEKRKEIRHLGRYDPGAFFRGNLIEHMDMKCYTNSDKKRKLFFILS